MLNSTLRMRKALLVNNNYSFRNYDIEIDKFYLLETIYYISYRNNSEVGAFVQFEILRPAFAMLPIIRIFARFNLLHVYISLGVLTWRVFVTQHAQFPCNKIRWIGGSTRCNQFP